MRLSPETKWAYTTIRTMLARLVEKGAISERKRSNVSFYETILIKSKARLATLKSVVNDAFEGAFGPLMHFLVEEDEWQTAMGPEGALEAFIEAKERGLARHLGVTGHELRVTNFHQRSLERYGFESVLLPYNPVLMKNPHYAENFETLLSICQERNIAVQTIKSISRGPWKNKEKIRATWYEPYEDQMHIDAIVHWVLSRPGIFLNAVGDIYLLPKVLDAVQRFDDSAVQADFEDAIAQMEVDPLFV